MGARAFAPLGVAVFGVSTLFGHWGFNLVCRIVEAITGNTLHLHVANLDQLREGFLHREGASVVLTSDFPESDLVNFVCASELPIITFSEDPGDMLDWVVSTRLPDYREGARLCSSMLSSLAAPFAAARALRIEGKIDGSPSGIVRAIIDHLFPRDSDRIAEQTFDYLVETGKVDREKLVDWSAYRPAEDNAAKATVDAETLNEVKRAIRSYGDLAKGISPEQIVWPQELFYRQDNRPPRAPFDLTGPARILFYGPYMHLPVGHWTARVEFEIDGASSGVEAATDVYINEVVTEKTFDMPAKGIYAFVLSFRVSDPRTAVQIRLFTRSSAIEGVFLPRSVRVKADQSHA